MRRDVALLVVVEPVQGEAPPWHEVYPPAGLVDGLRRYGGPVLQPVTQAVGESWHWSRKGTGGINE